MRLYFSGTPAEFKEVARDCYGVHAESSGDDEDDYGDGTQLPTADGGIILCGTVCEINAHFFKIRLGDSADVVQIFGEIQHWVLLVGDFVQVKVQLKPVQTTEDTFLYKLILEKFIGRIYVEARVHHDIYTSIWKILDRFNVTVD